MNMKDMIQRMTDLESSAKQQLTEDVNEGCGDMPMNPPMDQGNPVSMNVSLSASGKDHVSDLIDMMKNAGMNAAAPVSQDMMPMRTDIERLRGIVDGPEKDGKLDLDMDGDRQPDLDTESSIKESQSVDPNEVNELLKKFVISARDDYRAYGDVDTATVVKALQQGNVDAAMDAVAYQFAGDDGEEPGWGFDDALEELENEFKHMVGMGESVQEGVPGSLDAETVEAILKLKEVMMDKGMEPEEAQDEAAEAFGVDPEKLADHLDSQYDEGFDLEEFEVEGDDDDMGMGGDPADDMMSDIEADMDDDEMSDDDEEEPEEKDEVQQMREYVEKIGAYEDAKGGDEGKGVAGNNHGTSISNTNTKSAVPGKNDMGGDAGNLVQGGEEKGRAAPDAKVMDSGNVNTSGSRTATKMSQTKGHGAEKKGAGETADNKKSGLGS